MLVIKADLLDRPLYDVISDQLINCIMAKNVCNEPAWLGEIKEDGKTLNIIKFSRVYVLANDSLSMSRQMGTSLRNGIGKYGKPNYISGSSVPSIPHTYVLCDHASYPMNVSMHCYYGTHIRFCPYDTWQVETSTTIFIDSTDIFSDEYHYTNIPCVTHDMFKQTFNSIYIPSKLEHSTIIRSFSTISKSIETFMCSMLKLFTNYSTTFNYVGNAFKGMTSLDPIGTEVYNGSDISIGIQLCDQCNDLCLKKRFLFTNLNNERLLLCEFCNNFSSSNRRREFKYGQVMQYTNPKTYAEIFDDAYAASAAGVTLLPKHLTNDTIKEYIKYIVNVPVAQAPYCIYNTTIFYGDYAITTKKTVMSKVLNGTNPFQGKQLIAFTTDCDKN
jgi:hypothetical protein